MRIPLLLVLTMVVAIACQPNGSTASPNDGDAPASPSPTSEAPPSAVAGGWERRADAPLLLTEVAAAAHDGLIWVAGGLGDAGAVTAVMRYDPVADSWDRAPDLPGPIHHSSLVSTGTDLLLVGGYAGNSFDSPTAAVWRYDADAEAWVEAPPLPEPRGAGAAAWNGEGLVLYAGGVGPGGVSDSVFAFDGAAWTAAPPLSLPREHLAAAGPAEGGWVYFLGGRQGGLDRNLGRADLANGDETLSLGDVLTPRGGVAAFHDDDLGGCLVGGEGPDGTFADVECVDEGGRVTLPSLAHARHGLGAAVVDGTAYVLLGGEAPGLFISAIVESLDLDGP